MECIEDDMRNMNLRREDPFSCLGQKMALQEVMVHYKRNSTRYSLAAKCCSVVEPAVCAVSAAGQHHLMSKHTGK
jgi:hypothetical protein